MLESSSLDWINAAANSAISGPLSEAGHHRVEFSSSCEALFAGERRQRGSAVEDCAIVVTDIGVRLLTPRQCNVRHSLTPAGIGACGLLPGRPRQLFCSAAGDGDELEVVLLLPSERRGEQAERAVAALRDGDIPTATVELADWVTSRCPDLGDDDRVRLGLPARRSRDERTERWRAEQRAAHQRRQDELDALRRRSRSGSRSASPEHRDAARAAFRKEQDDARRRREEEAEARLEEQRVRAAQDRQRREQEEAMRMQQQRMDAAREEEEAAAARDAALAEDQERRVRRLRDEEEAREAERRRKEAAEVAERAERQRRERERQAALEKQRAERLAAERADQQELLEEKARRALEEERARVAASTRYALSQRLRQERSAVAQEEEGRRLTGRRKEEQSWAAIVDGWKHVSKAAAAALALRSGEEVEDTARQRTQLEERESRGHLLWAASRDHNHVCEIERRRLMDGETVRRVAVAEEQYGAVADLVLRLQGSAPRIAAGDLPEVELLGSDTSSDVPTDALTPRRPPATPGEPAFVSPECTVVDPGASTGLALATQTPGYGFATMPLADGNVIAAQIAELRQELRHERELRLRSEERLSEHHREIASKHADLEDRERDLLRQLDREHAERLEQVRGFLQPQIEGLHRFDDADKILSRVSEREEEWSRREQDLRKLQVDLEQECVRLRAELARVTEQHWGAEQLAAELRARGDAAEKELSDARRSAEKSEQRLREVLLEEQELISRHESAWRSRLSDAEARLANSEAVFARRIEERERFWSQQEQLLRERRERAETDRLALQERADGLQRRVEAAENESRRVREELNTDATVAIHRVTQDARNARDAAEQERRRRQGAEEALVGSLEEQHRLGQRLEEMRGRNSLMLRDAALAAARHEAEISRVTAIAPRGGSRVSVLVSLESASRSQLVSVWQERWMDILRSHYSVMADLAAAYAGKVPAAPRWCQAVNRGSLAEQNEALRELLELEEAKVEELQHSLAEVRRQRDSVSRSFAGDVHSAAVACLRLQIAEAEDRTYVEQCCRDEMVDMLTSRRGPVVAHSPPRQPAEEHPRGWECQGWLLSSLADWHGAGPWRRLFYFLDPVQKMLYYSASDPSTAPGAAVSALRLHKVLSVEVETFAAPGMTPPPVNRYQQIGFYLETHSGQKHRFCASSVAERTHWLDHLRRAVMKLAASRGGPGEWVQTPRRDSPARDRWPESPPPPSPTYRRLRRAEDSARAAERLGPRGARRPAGVRRQPDGGVDLEHMSYFGLADGF